MTELYEYSRHKMSPEEEEKAHKEGRRLATILRRDIENASVKKSLGAVKREAIRLGGIRGYDGAMVAAGIVEFIDNYLDD